MSEGDLARWEVHERMQGFIRARLRLLTTEEGGRRTPISTGYRSSWAFPPGVHDQRHDGPLVLEDAETLAVGDEADVRIHPLVPHLWPLVAPGLRLEMFEGARLVGEATVLAVIPPNA